MTLEYFFQKYPRIALGFSGGVDSSYLLYAGLLYGADIQPYYVKTVFQPQFEMDDAVRLTQHLGVNLKVLEFDILSLPDVKSNPADRCYHCKSALFGAVRRQALSDGYDILIDGTNASDDAADRPGMRALHELSVFSPLLMCGLEKNEIRKRSQEAGLFTWDKPAYACLATRILTGDSISPEILRCVERAEGELYELGFTDFRVRVYNGAARLQIKKEQMETAVKKASIIRESITPYFNVVLLDLAGR